MSMASRCLTCSMLSLTTVSECQEGKSWYWLQTIVKRACGNPFHKLGVTAEAAGAASASTLLLGRPLTSWAGCQAYRAFARIVR